MDVAEALTRQCTQCGEEYPATTEHFAPDTRRSSGLQACCWGCRRRRNRAAYHVRKNVVAYQRTRLDRKLRCLYGISLQEYEDRLEVQAGLCAVCGTPETATTNGHVKRLALDHSHETGRPRGLLCQRCNHAIGLLREDPAIIDAAKHYVLKWREAVDDR
jgi:hypothetical protein